MPACHRCDYCGSVLTCFGHAGCVCPECGTVWAFPHCRPLEGLETQLEIRPATLYVTHPAESWEEGLLP